MTAPNPRRPERRRITPQRARRTVVVLALAVIAAALGVPPLLDGQHDGRSLLALVVLLAAVFLHGTLTRDELDGGRDDAR